MRIQNRNTAIIIVVLLAGIIPKVFSFDLSSSSSSSLAAVSKSTTMAAAAAPSDNYYFHTNNAAAGTAASNNHSLGPRKLRKLVQYASLQNVRIQDDLDLGGIVWLEHLNLIVGDMDTATKFYVDFLGLTSEREANPKSNHFNLGQQQFHLAAIQKKNSEKEEEDDWPQRITGSIGLCVPSLSSIRERLDRAQIELTGTLFSIVEEDANIMTVTCPWGNLIHLYDISIDDEDGPSSSSSPNGAVTTSQQKMVLFHKEGGIYGPHRMAVRGNPGIRFVEIACEVGTSNSIAEFYETLLGCHVTRTTTATDDETGSNGANEAQLAIVSVGPGVHMVFVEQKQLSRECMNQMEGVHICIYISSFCSYNKLKDRDLIWTNPRFAHLDSCETWEEAALSRTFRFKDIVNIRTGEKLVELEHETRSMLHGQYMKVPPYISK